MQITGRVKSMTNRGRNGERERESRCERNGLNRVPLRFLPAKRGKKKEPKSSVRTEKYREIEIKTANTRNVDIYRLKYSIEY